MGLAVGWRMKAKRQQVERESPEAPKEPDSIDLPMNPIYGIYRRGWNGEGEYGDGDIVEVFDTNDYYG